MPRVDGLRSPYDKTLGGLHPPGRMLDKIRLKHAGLLPEHFHRNYGLSIGLDGQLCGFLGVKFEDVEAQVQAGRLDAEVVEWVFTTGLRPNRSQAHVWNEHSRKIGWNDRVTAFNAKVKAEPGGEHLTAITSFDLIEQSEEREPPAVKGEANQGVAVEVLHRAQTFRCRHPERSEGSTESAHASLAGVDPSLRSG